MNATATIDLKQLEHNVEVYRDIHARAVAAGTSTRLPSQWFQQAQDTLTRAKAQIQEAEKKSFFSGEDEPVDPYSFMAAVQETVPKEQMALDAPTVQPSARQELIRQANHLSCCRNGFYHFAARVMEFFDGHGGEWYTYQDVLGDYKVKGWEHFGKRSVEMYLDLMVEDGTIEVAASKPRMMRKKV
jgi:hypothetical protein